MYRKEQLDNILSKLDTKIKFYQNRITILSRISNRATIIALSMARTSTSTAITSLSVPLPTAIITICVASTCVMATGVNKVAAGKLKKCQKKLRLVEDK